MTRDLDDSLLTVKEAAKILRVHPETVRGWLREGALAGVKPGAGGRWRVLKAAVEKQASMPESDAPLATPTSPLLAESPKEARRG
jgi:excisionase family DNA binding protein